jgi:thioredoxin-related protein
MKFLLKSVVISSIVVLTFTHTLYSQQIKWMSFDEAVAAHQHEKKKIIVDIFTDWCTWCQKMDQSTFQNAFIANYINEHFYAVKFNAEQQEKITFNSKEYFYVKSGRRGYHELAVELALGRLSYPTVVFLDENLQVIQALRGFQSALRFEQIMTYFAQDFHKTTPWSKFSENYQTFISHN